MKKMLFFTFLLSIVPISFASKPSENVDYINQCLPEGSLVRHAHNSLSGSLCWKWRVRKFRKRCKLLNDRLADVYEGKRKFEVVSAPGIPEHVRSEVVEHLHKDGARDQADVAASRAIEAIPRLSFHEKHREYESFKVILANIVSERDKRLAQAQQEQAAPQEQKDPAL